MINEIELKTGNIYTIGQLLFSEKRKIIIPDIQRDYCWGNPVSENEKELVGPFVNNLIKQYEEFQNDNKPLNLGLIYGYEFPKTHIQLCDGQQRITTLFLLLGMINRKCKDNEFKTYLISEIEYTSSEKTPQLQYAIRESTLYFLSDLVCEFFLKSDVALEKLESQIWFFADYKLDPSIMSICESIRTIEKNINCIESPSKFGHFILERITFMYYDMETPENGENTFVIINTTGVPLTSTENLKPRLIASAIETKRDEYANVWEEWETWFWQHRDKSINDTSDVGMNEFFRWVVLLNSNKQEVDDILATTEKNDGYTVSYFELEKTKRHDNDLISDLNKYFEIVKFLFENIFVDDDYLKWLSPKSNIEQIDCFILLPVINYILRFGKNDLKNISRVKIFFENLARIDNIRKSVNVLIHPAIEFIGNLPNSDIASIIKLKSVSTQILTKEERIKFTLFTNKKYDRDILEELFWKDQEHDIFKGQIMPLLNWSTSKDIFDLEKYKNYSSLFNKLFYGNLKYHELDITRRVLLTFIKNISIEENTYPVHYRCHTNISFCWKSDDWQTVIMNTTKIFKTFLDIIMPKYLKHEDIYDFMENICDKYKDKTHKWYDFIKYEGLLTYCKEKNIQEVSNKIRLIPGERSTRYAELIHYKYFLDLQAQMSTMYKEINNQWKINFWDIKDEGCIYFERTDLNLVIEIGEEYTLWVFRRNTNPSDIKSFFKGKLSSDFKWDNENEMYHSPSKKKKELRRYIIETIKKIETILS